VGVSPPLAATIFVPMIGRKTRAKPMLSRLTQRKTMAGISVGPA
jgi:hypothetical protein